MTTARELISSRFAFLAHLGLQIDSGRRVLSKRELGALAGELADIMRALGGVAVRAPYFEHKVACGMALGELACSHRALGERLRQLGQAVPVGTPFDPLVERCAGLEEQRRSLSALAARIRELETTSDRLADWSTFRVLSMDLAPVLSRTTRMCGAALDASGGRSRLADMGDRDGRYTTFSDTSDYLARITDVGVDRTDQTVVAQLRTQRDELDAVETFARALASESDLTASEFVDLATIVADESRHALLGELGLADCGLDPFAIPIGTIGALLRSRMDPRRAVAQICLGGEATNLSEIRIAGATARDSGRVAIANSLDAIHRDEVFHLRFGTRLLARFFGRPLKGLRDELRQATQRFLLDHRGESRGDS